MECHAISPDYRIDDNIEGRSRSDVSELQVDLQPLMNYKIS